MPTAKEIAVELRILADAFDKEPDTNLPRPFFSFHGCEKEEFMALARLLPHPLEKKFTGGNDFPEIEIGYIHDAIWVYAKASRDKVCRVVEPAKPAVYECEPLLSKEEEAGLVAQEQG